MRGIPAKPALSESQSKDPATIVRCYLAVFPLTGGFFDFVLQTPLRMTACILSDKLQLEASIKNTGPRAGIFYLDTNHTIAAVMIAIL